MSRLSETTLGELGSAAARYRPVAVVVVAIVAMAQLLPGGADDPDPLAATGPTRSPAVGEPAEREPAAPEPEVEVPAGGDDQLIEPSAPFDAGSSFGGSDGGSFEGGDGFDSGSTGGSTAPPSTFTFPTSTTTTAPPRPLRITATAWASRTAGTPLGASGVPPQTLPVGKRLGQTDKASYIRLAGTAEELVLKEDPEGTRVTQGVPAVQACRITEAGWDEGGEKTFDQAPAHDPEACVVGTRGDDGRWTFDLSAFPARTDDKGFALLPAPDAPVDFQVAFQEQSVG